MVALFFKKHSTLFLSILIFLLIIILIGIPFSSWWGEGSDAFLGLYYGYEAKTWKDLIAFFRDGNVNPASLNNPTFFSAFYRPMTRIMLGLEYWAFGINFYYYFLVDVIFHAINTTLLFNIFLLFSGNITALLGALFFAFHPLIGYKFGVLGNVQYYMNTTLILLTLMFLKKYIDSGKIYFYLLSIFLFIFSILLRETGLVLPGIIFLGIYLYKNIDKKIGIRTFCVQFKDNLKIAVPYGICVIFYLILRACLYPMNLVGFNAILACNKNLNVIQKLAELKNFIYDALALTWLPWHNPAVRGTVIIFSLFLLLWLFINNSKKTYVLFFSLCVFLMLWPAFIENYCARYFYEIYPFILASIILIFQFYQGNLLKLKKIAFLALTIECIFIINLSLESFLIREKNMKIYACAIENLIKNPKIINCDSIFVLSTPLPALGFHLSRLLSVLLDKPFTKIQVAGSSTACFDYLKTTPFKISVNQYSYDGDLEVIKLGNGFRFKNLSANKSAFDVSPCTSYCYGHKIINKVEPFNGSEVITDYTILIDPSYLTKENAFIAWDIKLKKYMIL